LNKDKKVPLLWQVLSNKYGQDIQFGSHHDRKGKTSLSMSLKAGEKKASKVVIYPVDSTVPVLYEGLNKFDSLSKFFDSVLDGTANLKVANEEAKAEEVVSSEEDIEIEQKQEAPRIALAHGGFADFIDFEEAIKNGHGAGYHDVHGYDTKDSTASQKEETQKEEKANEEVIAPKAGEDEQVVLEAVKETGHTEAYVVEPEETKNTAASPSPEAVEEHPKDEL